MGKQNRIRIGKRTIAILLGRYFVPAQWGCHLVSELL